MIDVDKIRKQAGYYEDVECVERGIKKYEERIEELKRYLAEIKAKALIDEALSEAEIADIIDKMATLENKIK